MAIERVESPEAAARAALAAATKHFC
jgi:hypothetical protein